MWGWNVRKLEYDVVMDAGPDTEVLGRVRDLDFGATVYMAAVAKYPNRNIQLRQGERIIKRHDGEPKPAPPAPVDPNLKNWSIHLIGGKKMQHLGFVQAIGEQAEIEAAVEKFGLDDQKRRRLAFSPTQ
jgi:hypothetical protein